ncbi:MAG: DUF2284 domain-containing protein [Oscillospiraceae bacterium]|nr:DUF2284 domain-containing protein [Oscillospiraceae bacterium]
MNGELLEEKLRGLPLLQYVFISTDELVFSENVRYICRTECPMYGRTWACPPAVGTVEQCREKCMRFTDGLLFSTVTEVSDIADIEETLSTRAPHEEITRKVRDMAAELYGEVLTLSTEACAVCESCAYTEGKPCRHPERMFPCVESHGIIVTELAEKHGMDFFNGGNIVTWFSLILFSEKR